MAPNPYKIIGFGGIHGPKPYEFIGFGDIHGPKPYESIVDPSISEEASRRCEHDQNKAGLVQLLFTKLREALGKETNQHKIKLIKNMLNNSRESFHNACRMKNEDIATLIRELDEQIAHGDKIDSGDT